MKAKHSQWIVFGMLVLVVGRQIFPEYFSPLTDLQRTALAIGALLLVCTRLILSALAEMEKPDARH